MRLSPKALAIAVAILWGGVAMFLTGLLSLIIPPYGEHFLLTMSSVYPGFKASGSFVDVLVGTGYGLVDGAICGFLLGWFYNLILAKLGPQS